MTKLTRQQKIELLENKEIKKEVNVENLLKIFLRIIKI